MSIRRRQCVLGFGAMAGAAWTPHALAQGAGTAALAVPGPSNSVSMPLELARRLGIDRDEGLPLRLSFVGGGGVAIQELQSGNAEFAVFGLPAMVRANLTGSARMVALAALDDLPLYTLVVRSDLRGSVRSVRDLDGRTLGVHSNSLQVRTTSHQLADYVLRRHGVDPKRVKIVAAGQSWETQSSMLLSRGIDASMCDEPFATRMEAEGMAYKIFSTGEPADAARAPGVGFLRAVLVALQQQVDAAPQRAEAAVRVVRRVLGWIASHSAEQFADQLGLQGRERASMLMVAQAYPRQYSRDARFSAAQIAETELFFRESNDDLPRRASVRIAEMLVDKWVGSRP